MVSINFDNNVDLELQYKYENKAGLMEPGGEGGFVCSNRVLRGHFLEIRM